MSTQQQLGLFGAVAATDIAARFVQRDICARKHGGNRESLEAHERAKLGKQDMWAKIIDWGRKQAAGFTCDEAAIHFMCPPNAISGRLSELKAQGRLVRTEERRKTRSGCWARILKVRV